MLKIVLLNNCFNKKCIDIRTVIINNFLNLKLWIWATNNIKPSNICNLRLFKELVLKYLLDYSLIN